MTEYFFPIAFGFILICMGGLGYFTIWRLTDETHSKVKSYKSIIEKILGALQAGREIILTWNGKFSSLEDEIKHLREENTKLIDFIQSEKAVRGQEMTEMIRALNVSERESRLVEISKNLQLLTNRK